jgi:hypothetical protein
VLGSILPILEKLNPLGHFFKDNHEFKDFIKVLTDATFEIVNVLTKIVNMTCITKICLLVKLLKKFEELKAEFEVKKSKSTVTFQRNSKHIWIKSGKMSSITSCRKCQEESLSKKL